MDKVVHPQAQAHPKESGGHPRRAPRLEVRKPAPEHPLYLYLLRGLAITRPNQVWAADITYIPMARGFAYLLAIIDRYSRRVLAWRLSNTLQSRFCVEAVEEALAHFSAPEIFNTDQGSQFTAQDFTDVLLDRGGEDPHGRQGPLHRQHLRRAPVAFAEVRGGLPQLLRWHDRGPQGTTCDSSTTSARTPPWATRRRHSSMMRSGGARHELYRCARPPPGSALRSDPAARGACGGLDPVCAHRYFPATGCRQRPATAVSILYNPTTGPSRPHLNNA